MMKKALFLVFFVITFMSYSQENPFDLSLSSGISIPSSNFSNNGYAENGIYFELDGAYYFSKFGIGVSVGQLSSPTNENFSNSIISVDIPTTNTTQNWKQFYYGIGPEYKTQFGNFSATFSAKIGLQSVKSINLESNYTNGETPLTIFKIESGKNTSLSYFSTGLKFGYNLSSNFSLYATANYIAAFSDKITISESKIADINNNGIIDAEDIDFAIGSDIIDYEISSQNIKPQNINFGIGLSFEFGNNFSTVKEGKTGGAKDSDINLKRNPVYEGETNSGENPIYVGDERVSVVLTNPVIEKSDKKECLKKGGSFWENGDNTYLCMNTLLTTKVSVNSSSELFRSKKKKCFISGGQWVTNLHGSFCWNPSATSKVYGPGDADTDDDGLEVKDDIEIFDSTDNDCDDRSSLKRMNKAELIDAMAKDANLSKADAKKALESLTSNLSKSSENGSSVQLVGFQQSISARAARTGRNPQTGATIKIAPYNPQRNGGNIQRNKAELTDAIAKDANLSKADAGKALNSFIAIILKEVNNGNCVKLIIPSAIREDEAIGENLLRGVEKSDIKRGMKTTPSTKEQTKLLKDKENKKGIYYGKLMFKPSVTKSNGRGELSAIKGALLTIREKSTGKIIAKTTVDGSGIFKFNALAMRKGLELSWALPQQAGEPIVDEWGCWVILPSSPAEPLEPMEECDDSELVLRVGLANCTNPPCPWERD